MNQTVITALAVMGILFAALYGASVMTAAPHGAKASLGPMDILQMMRDAKDLPVQQFDAI